MSVSSVKTLIILFLFFTSCNKRNNNNTVYLTEHSSSHDKIIGNYEIYKPNKEIYRKVSKEFNSNYRILSTKLRITKDSFYLDTCTIIFSGTWTDCNSFVELHPQDSIITNLPSYKTASEHLARIPEGFFTLYKRHGLLISAINRGSSSDKTLAIYKAKKPV